MALTLLGDDGSYTQTVNTDTSARTTGTNTRRTEGSVTTDRLDPASRSAYNALLSTIRGGGSDSFQLRQGARDQQVKDLQASRGQFSEEAARTQAQGDVQGLTRNLIENIIPQFTGAAEAGGASSNALTALLSQDAATRTGEAQSRELRKAIIDFATQQRAVDSQLQTATQGGNELEQLLLETLNVGKGSFEKTDTSSVVTDIIDQLTRNTGTVTTNRDANGGGGSGSGGGASGVNRGNQQSAAERSVSVAALDAMIPGGIYQNQYRQYLSNRGGGLNPSVSARYFADREAKAEINRLLGGG